MLESFLNIIQLDKSKEEILKITTKFKHYLFFLSLYIFLGIPLAILRFPDIRNEMKYLVITQSMLSSKNFWVLRYFSDLYPDKPPLYFWILGISQKIFGSYAFNLSIILGSLLPSLIITIFFYKFIKNFLEDREAFYISSLLCTLPYFLGVSLFLRMDMLMSCFIFLSIYLFFNFYYNFTPINFKNLSLFYLFIFLGVFTKGIAGFFIPIITIFTFLIFEKNLKFVKNIYLPYGIFFILSLFILWFFKIYSSDLGKEYISLLLGQETVGRIVNSKAHIKPFYYYLEQLPLLTFPYTLITVGSLIFYIRRIKTWKNWEKLEKISFCYLLFPFLGFSLASGKLSIYLLPLLPATLIMNYLFLRKENSIGKKLLRLTFILEVFPMFFTYIFKKFNKFSILIISNIFILVILLFGINFYNKEYTLKPFIEIVNTLPSKVEGYKFEDITNLSCYLEDNINNSNEFESLSEKYILTRNKYDNPLKNSNYRLIYSNKLYSLFEKLE